MVRVTVGDRGPGVDDADVDRLFAPMRRPLASSAVEGEPVSLRMGMGLSIARTFARAQRGDVQYRHRDGGGSEFSLHLPLGAET
jgi:two-component system sensor histidine kinase KdpD